MIRNSPSGALQGLARLLFGGGNDAGGYPITNLGAPESPSSAARLADVEGISGAIRKYTIGPTWTGAEHQTWASAIAQAVADGHSTSTTGTGVVFYPYGVRFVENVTIPATLPRWSIVAVGGGTGTQISGTFTVDMPTASGNWTIQNLTVIGNVVLNKTGAGQISGIMFDCQVFGGITAVAEGLNLQVWAGEVTGEVAFNGRDCRILNGRLTRPSSANNAITSTASVRTTLRNVGIVGRCTFAGASAVMQKCTQSYQGPAVTESTTTNSFCEGNDFLHDAGGSGAVWVKNGAGLFHPGGNTFTEGQVYPWYQINAGTVADPAESDIQIRRLLEVSGSPVLTAAQIGGQRKTTVGKTNGGGSVTLPTVSSAIPTVAGSVEPDTTLIVKDLNGNATAAPFTIAGSGGQLIDGAASFAITTDYQAVELQATASGWAVIGSYL